MTVFIILPTNCQDDETEPEEDEDYEEDFDDMEEDDEDMYSDYYGDGDFEEMMRHYDLWLKVIFISSAFFVVLYISVRYFVRNKQN